jgi:hypothetical protein
MERFGAALDFFNIEEHSIILIKSTYPLPSRRRQHGLRISYLARLNLIERGLGRNADRWTEPNAGRIVLASTVLRHTEGKR